jgi:uncharacterized protein
LTTFPSPRALPALKKSEAALTISLIHFGDNDSKAVMPRGQFIMGNSFKSAAFLIESKLADAMRGDPEAYYELGIAYSSGSAGTEIDYIQAHKWFNLAAMTGNERAQECRAEVADDMSAREIAEAQRQARAWLSETNRWAA